MFGFSFFEVDYLNMCVCCNSKVTLFGKMPCSFLIYNNTVEASAIKCCGSLRRMALLRRLLQ